MIVSLGDLTLDILVKPEAGHHRRMPSPGSVTMTSGGSAANFAAWASRLGGNVRFVGKVGNDPAADLLIIDLLKEGVLAETVVEPGSTATMVQMLGRNGEKTYIPDRGVAVKLKPEELKPEWFADATWLHIPATSFFELPIATAAAKAVHLARQAKSKVSIELASAPMLRKYGAGKFAVLLKSIRPDVIFANQDQAMLFASGALGDLAHVAVLKLGSAGCALSDETGYHEFKADKVQLVDASGAGDAFDAAWCVNYMRTHSCEIACRLANKLAARVVGAAGCRPNVSLAGVLARR